MEKIIKSFRFFLWRILGFDYERILKNNNYVLLKYDKHVTIGEKSYNNGAKVWRWTPAPLVIGNYCSIAHNVSFLMDEGYHQISEITSFPFINNLTTNPEHLKLRANMAQKKGITIGNDVWIGLNVVVLPGVRIGNGCTIAANSVVTKDVLDYSVVGGVPAKLIRRKFELSEIQEMNQIAWWNWSEELLSERMQDFYTLNVSEFIEKYS